jgi:hypothetical protein
MKVIIDILKLFINDVLLFKDKDLVVLGIGTWIAYFVFFAIFAIYIIKIL